MADFCTKFKIYTNFVQKISFINGFFVAGHFIYTHGLQKNISGCNKNLNYQVNFCIDYSPVLGTGDTFFPTF